MFRDDGVDVHLDENGEPRVVERRFIVEPELAGSRLDHFLVRKIPRLSRTRAQAIIRATVTFEGPRVAKPNSRLAPGDVLIMRRRAQPEPPCRRDFETLFQSGDVMVIDKPAGLPVHMSARYYFNTLTRVLSEKFPGQGWQLCHRLDRETSGVLVLARGKDAGRVVKGAFARKQVKKRYVAIARGHVAESAFEIDRPLGLTKAPDAMITIRMVVRADAMPSITRVECLQRLDGPDGAFSLLACSPVSGRQHQIRAHLASIGHPIVGDKLYGHGDEMFAAACDDRLTDAERKALLLPRHALHAESIEFPLPGGGTQSVSAPMPELLASFIARNQADSQ